MATIRGILGVIEGSAGSSTFSTLNGRNILRQKVGSNGSNSVPQQRTRNQFKALAALHKAGLGTATRAGLLKQNGKSSYNRFVGLNFGTATSADVNTAVATVDFAKVVVSAGSVLGTTGLTATAGAGTVAFAFGNNTDGISGLALDKVTVVVVNKLTNLAYSATGAVRTAGTQALAVPGLTAATKASYAAYAFFKRADGSDASLTAYVALL